MRAKLERYLNEVWYGGDTPPAWLRALVPLYRAGFWLDRKLKSARQPAALKGRAIVVVGSVVAGGSGKTPLVIRLCQLARQAGYRPAVISRGYGRSSGVLAEVSKDSSPADVGDEPLIIARRSGAPVVVAADRCAAAQFLFDRGADLVISDDGLQHHRLPRTVEICVVDGQRGFGNGELLPAGPLREPPSRLKDVDFVVINGAQDEVLSKSLPGDGVNMELAPGLLHALNGTETWRLSQFTGCKVNAIAGIGNPDRFFRVLQQAGLQTRNHAFPDHHTFTRQDFSALEPGLPLLMTEKDAVKCRGLGLDNAWFLAVEAMLPATWETAFLQRLDAGLAQHGKHPEASSGP
ncbi:MAG: tetraacyldisaccharide 4'-kinase [Xanthomonadales bacterium]|nr:tetraacyldisaccharide 4'-kinase [Xanthomonadales bacterium]